MNKKQADIEAKKIISEANKKADDIIKEAKESGTWEKGLDSNKELFVGLYTETKKKLKELASMVDEK